MATRNTELHRNRRTPRHPIPSTLLTLANLRCYVGALVDFGELLDANGNERLQSIGTICAASMRYIDGELAALEQDFVELDQIRREKQAAA